MTLPVTILSQLQQAKLSGRKQLAILLDPDHLSLEAIQPTIERCNEAKVDYIFVGGSLIMHNQLDTHLQIIKQYTKIPAILFPGNLLQISTYADAIFFLSLISGRNPEMLIGQHILAAPLLRKTSLEVLPTGYILVDGGKQTSVSYMSNTTPIPADKPNIALSTALAGEMLGLQLIYMDAGSGAEHPASPEMIHRIASQLRVPFIVGGGMRTPEQAAERAAAGADVVVVGNAVERDPGLISEIARAVHQLNPGKQEG